MLAPLILAFYC